VATPSNRFRSFAGSCALIIAAGNVGYAVAFLIIRPDNPDGGTASAALLALGGLLAIPVFIALYRILAEREPDFALLALVLGAAGAIGATVHGAYDIANEINPPADFNDDLPNAIDPRGLLTFGVTGLALASVSYAILASGALPRSLGQLAGVLSVLLLFVYAMRLTVLDPDDAIVVAPAALTGFVLSPIYYVWLGLTLRRS
jgi:hypothetical protein